MKGATQYDPSNQAHVIASVFALNFSFNHSIRVNDEALPAAFFPICGSKTQGPGHSMEAVIFVPFER